MHYVLYVYTRVVHNTVIICIILPFFFSFHITDHRRMRNNKNDFLYRFVETIRRSSLWFASFAYNRYLLYTYVFLYVEVVCFVFYIYFPLYKYYILLCTYAVHPLGRNQSDDQAIKCPAKDRTLYYYYSNPTVKSGGGDTANRFRETAN